MEERRPAGMYIYQPQNHEPLDAEGLSWLADQLCSDTRVHPDRTMSIGWITSQAAYEYPAMYDALTNAEAEAAELRAEVERLRVFALKAFTIVEWATGEGYVLKAPHCDCDDTYLEGVALLGVETADEARAALAAKDAAHEIAIRQLAMNHMEELAARDATIHQLGENAAKASAEYAERVAVLDADKERLDWLQSEMNDVRWIGGESNEMCSPSDEVGVRIVSHWQAKPYERVEAENWNEDLRAAIDQARAALTEPTDEG